MHFESLHFHARFEPVKGVEMTFTPAGAYSGIVQCSCAPPKQEPHGGVQR